MKTILILRHAKSSWASDTLSDHERPLNSRGERDAPRMGGSWDEVATRPDPQLQRRPSPHDGPPRSRSLRLRGSHRAVARFLSGRCLHFRDALSRLSDDHSRVLVVAHNPDSRSCWTEADRRRRRCPPPLAVVALPVERWQGLPADGQAQLMALWRPRELTF